MSELKADKTFVFGEECLAYKKSEADKVIADLEESHKKEIGQLLIEIAELNNEIKKQKRLRNMALASVPNVLKVMKIIQHQKYRRCLAMARECENEEKYLDAIAPLFETDKECWEYNSDYWNKWRKRWDAIAEKFKPNKETKE